MARKPRDYKAEERRRNELAQQRGFKTRASQRGKIERGEIAAIQPKRVRSPKVKAAQAKFISGPLNLRKDAPSFEQAYAELVAGKSKEQLCIDWSRDHAHTTVSLFDVTETSKKGVRGAPWNQASNKTLKRKQAWIAKHGYAAYVDAYYDAFVAGDDAYVYKRHDGGSDALDLWFIEITGYLDAEEYEKKYGSVKA